MLAVLGQNILKLTPVASHKFASLTLADQVAEYSYRVVIGSLILVSIILILSVYAKSKQLPILKPLFILLASIVLMASLAIVASVFYLNTKSASKGIEYRQAGIEFWVCQNELELRDPDLPLSTKLGSPILYEANDKKIHFNGYVVDPIKDVSLGKFMEVIGGEINDNTLLMPLNSNGDYFEDDIDGDGKSDFYPHEIKDYIVYSGDQTFLRAVNGDNCGQNPARLQVFVYKFDPSNNTYKQEKISNPENYVISNYPTIPPGDCIIVEFDIAKPQTDKLCREYGLADKVRCGDFGAKKTDPKFCYATQIDYPVLDPNQDKLINSEGS